MNVQRFFPVVLLGAAATLLGACSGVGNGSRPKSMEIIHANALLGTDSDKAFVCFPEGLALRIIFDNGHYDSGFASRATWTSSNPDVVEVSNGDVLVPGSTTNAYDVGVIFPKRPGTATITATFSELSASYDLVVEEPQSLSLDATSMSMAKHSTSPINLKAVLDGYTRTVTSAAFTTWAFTDEDPDSSDDSSPDDIVALLFDSNGNPSLQAGKTLGSRILQAKLPGCPEDSPAAALAENLTVPVQVRDIQTLTLTPEFPAEQPINLLKVGTRENPIATSEKMTVTAGFGDGVADTQDLSSQVTLRSSDSTIAQPTIGFVLAAKAGTANITATYPIIGADEEPVFDDVGPITSAAVPVTVGERTYGDLAVSPSGEQTINALDSIQYHAIATMTDGTTQDITRHVLWSTSDATIVVIGNGSSVQAGTAFSVQIPQDEPDSVDVTATLALDDKSDGDTKEVTVPLKIQALAGD